MATVAEKLQLTLNSKNSIKLALEKNNVSTEGKVFSDYGDLVDKAINSGWPEIVYSISTGAWRRETGLMFPYDFKVRLDTSEYNLTNKLTSYRIGEGYDDIYDTEAHLGKAGDYIYVTASAPNGYLHITRA